MNFRHEFLTPIALPRQVVEGKRYYVSPSGQYLPSVTTVLRDYYKKDFRAWRKRVGEAEADAITFRAASRGTSLHTICERYLNNDLGYLLHAQPSTLADFFPVREILKENVTSVMGIEFPLFSERLRTAGTADLICTWGNRPTIVDFKTSRKLKRESWIEDYFVQASVYGEMVKENYNIDVEQIVIVMVVEHEEPTLFQKESRDYADKVETIFVTSRKDTNEKAKALSVL